jgi:phage host-nuclease inhibitor protein Gam
VDRPEDPGCGEPYLSVHGQAKVYKAQIDSWFERVVREEQDSVDYFRSILKPFIERALSDQKSKTLKLPGLSIQLRKKPDKVEVTDKEIAISFCEANHPDAVVIKKEVSKIYLKDLLTKKGELVPGCDIVFGIEGLHIRDI